MPTWTAVDSANVRTMRELMENMRKDGWNVEYHRYLCLSLSYIYVRILTRRGMQDTHLARTTYRSTCALFHGIRTAAHPVVRTTTSTRTCA